jgi:nicotinamide phosphoribosyltransferase
MKYSILFDTDSYKVCHYLTFPEETTSLFSYIESRQNGQYPEMVFIGLQYYLKEYLTHRITMEEVEEAKELYELHGEPFNYEGWKYIATILNGKLPVRIRAVPEGSVILIDNIMVSIESTDNNVPWIVSWIETMLLRIWYPITVSTRSFTIKKIIRSALDKSSDNADNAIKFALHNFSSRGVSSQESAMIADIAHIIHFMGTDTTVGLKGARDYYHCNMSGFSIPAAEHSSIIAWGKNDEVNAYRNMLKQFAKPGALVAVVSDSYDLYNACEHIWGEQLKQEVIDSKATVILRPDSGFPPEVVLKTAQILDSKFGSTTNSKGYKVLNYVRIIQGDGVNEESIKEILDRLLVNGFSAENCNFGCGGYLAQQVNRDTNRFAMKLSSICVSGINRETSKAPLTDLTKKSKGGRLDLIKENGEYKTVRLPDNEIALSNSEMRTVFLNGDLLIDETLDTIRERVS